MKKIQEIELNQYRNKCIEERFVSLLINKDLQEISKLLNPVGTFSNMGKSKFIDYLEDIFLVFNYKIVSYYKFYSARLKVSEVVHSFKFSMFDRYNIDIESITFNLLLTFSENQIQSIYTENDFITEEEFEIRQFNN